MGFSDYEFMTRWRVEAEAGEVYDLLSGPENFSRWIKGFSIQVTPVASGNADGVGRKERFTVKGYLPYSLSWEMECVKAQRPYGFTSRATGDLEGQGIWTFVQRRIWTDITFDWRIRAQKPLLRYTSFLLQPLFKWNHDWIMTRWEKDLQQALIDRRQSK